MQRYHAQAPRIRVFSVATSDAPFAVAKAKDAVEAIRKKTPNAEITELHGPNVTYGAIRAYLDRVIQEAGADDVLWFQYNGHGSNHACHLPIDLIDLQWSQGFAIKQALPQAFATDSANRWWIWFGPKSLSQIIVS